MADRYRIINARIPGYEELQALSVQQGTIAAIHPQAAISDGADMPVVDVTGDWLSPSGIDLQINGALGLAFPDLTPTNADKLPEIGEFLWRQGVSGFLPTLVTTSVEKIQQSLAALSHFISSPLSLPPHTARPLGVHLEGPFLNPSKRGAHPPECLLPLTLDNVKRVLGDYASLVKIITLAPELDESGQVIPYLRSRGIIVSLGHSLATATQAHQAFDQGASMVTHAFNAMPGLHHREPGLLGAAMIHPAVYCGLIADGQHVSPTMAEILLRASYGDRGVFLVSDALAPLGLPDGTYPWDRREITVTGGTARLPDGTLAGTTLPLLTAVQNLVKWGVCPVESAIALATVAPRRAIGLSADCIHQPAHCLRWHLNPAKQLTWDWLYPPTCTESYPD